MFFFEKRRRKEQQMAEMIENFVRSSLFVEISAANVWIL